MGYNFFKKIHSTIKRCLGALKARLQKQEEH